MAQNSVQLSRVFSVVQIQSTCLPMTFLLTVPTSSTHPWMLLPRASSFKPIPTSGTLHLLFPLSGTLTPCLHRAVSLLNFRSQLQCHFSKTPSLKSLTTTHVSTPFLHSLSEMIFFLSLFNRGLPRWNVSSKGTWKYYKFRVDFSVCLNISPIGLK